MCHVIIGVAHRSISEPQQHGTPAIGHTLDSFHQAEDDSKPKDKHITFRRTKCDRCHAFRCWLHLRSLADIIKHGTSMKSHRVDELWRFSICQTIKVKHCSTFAKILKSPPWNSFLMLGMVGGMVWGRVCGVVVESLVFEMSFVFVPLTGIVLFA